jgi:hypothetical protein
MKYNKLKTKTKLGLYSFKLITAILVPKIAYDKGRIAKLFACAASKIAETIERQVFC